MTLAKDAVTFIIPTLNEEGAIGKVIDETRRAGFRNIVIVDGGSTDKTVELAEQKGAKVIRERQKGKTEAVKTGIAIAETEFVALIDGDGSYDPADVEKMLLVAPDYDEVIGQRCLERAPVVRRVGNRVVSFLVSSFLGIPLSDVCSGLYLLRTDRAKELILTKNGFSTEVEIAFGIASAGSISQVPISYRERIGESKLSLWKHGPQILLAIFSLARNRSQRETSNGTPPS
jgi:dolichol-phosphate mannosyltransferase